MIIVHPTSLTDTLDSAAEALFYQKSIIPPLRNDLAAMLISRQIQSGSNSGFFIPFASESRTQSRLFTGERLQTEFACRNIQLIEAVRLLALLALDDPIPTRAVQLSNQLMDALCYSKFCAKGECKSLTIAYMRYLAAINTAGAAVRLDQFLTMLAGYRDGKGKWHGFPFYYTLLMLSETDHPLATDELGYAAPSFEKLSRQDWSNDRYSNRCQSILDNIMVRSENDAYPLLLGQY
jgi:hypothetical protein